MQLISQPFSLSRRVYGGSILHLYIHRPTCVMLHGGPDCIPTHDVSPSEHGAGQGAAVSQTLQQYFAWLLCSSQWLLGCSIGCVLLLKHISLQRDNVLYLLPFPFKADRLFQTVMKTRCCLLLFNIRVHVSQASSAIGPEPGQALPITTELHTGVYSSVLLPRSLGCRLLAITRLYTTPAMYYMHMWRAQFDDPCVVYNYTFPVIYV